MERQFTLPLALAAAAHAALLFGFSKTPGTIATVGEPTCIFPFILNPPEPPVPEEDDPTVWSGPPPIALPIPRSPEPPSVVVDVRPTMIAPPVPLVDLRAVTHVITGPTGITGGDGTASWRKDVTSGLDLDNPPRTRFQAAPIYPFEGKREGLRGEVMVEFMVDESGKVYDPRVVNSSHRMFEDATLRAVAKWQFEPGRRGGKIVQFKMVVPVVFTLNE